MNKTPVLLLLSTLLAGCLATPVETEKISYFSNIHTVYNRDEVIPKQGQSMLVFSATIDSKWPAFVSISNFDGNEIKTLNEPIRAVEFQPGLHRLRLTWHGHKGDGFYKKHSSLDFEFNFEMNAIYVADFQEGRYVLYQVLYDTKVEVKRVLLTYT